jgi:glycosyltransferase involved in cell wall biosynthesis
MKIYSQTIVIPTRNRQETAVFAVKSCLNASYDKKQIVVVDNSDDDSLKNLLSDAGVLNLIDYHKNDSVLSMRDNWEKGLEIADGELISVIGDDDAILKSSMEVANFAFNRAEIDVLNGSSALYKWPNYPFPGRKNYLSFGFGEEIKINKQPQEMLRSVYSYEVDLGTGPGLYYGFVKKEFMNRLKKIRGKYLIDKIPDFDSGYATLLYAKAYAISNRPLFIQGHSAKSNSGSMRYTSTQRKNIEIFASESHESIDGIFSSSLSDLRSNEAVIVSAQLRFLEEIERVLGKNALVLNKEKAWNYIKKGLSEGYDAIGFISSIPMLKRLSEEWNIPYAINNKFQPGISNSSLIYEQGFIKKINSNATELNSSNTNSNAYYAVVVNGVKLGFQNILDAVNHVDAMLPTMRSSTDKDFADYSKKLAAPEMDFKLLSVRQLINQENYEEAFDLLEEILSVGDVDMVANNEVEAVAENLQAYDWASRYFARRFSATGSLIELERLITYYKKIGADELINNLNNGLSLLKIEKSH